MSQEPTGPTQQLKGESIVRFEGDWIDEAGKLHHIVRKTCLGCGEVLYEMHYACCGHGASGFGSTGIHVCGVGHGRE